MAEGKTKGLGLKDNALDDGTSAAAQMLTLEPDKDSSNLLDNEGDTQENRPVKGTGKIKYMVGGTLTRVLVEEETKATWEIQRQQR